MPWYRVSFWGTNRLSLRRGAQRIETPASRLHVTEYPFLYNDIIDQGTEVAAQGVAMLLLYLKLMY